jgi:hypothetical protein
VHGCDDILGAAAKPLRHKIVKSVLTAAQLQKAAKGAIDMGSKASKAADKHEKMISALNAKVKAGAASARQKLHMGAGGKTVTIKGVDPEIADVLLGTVIEVLGLSPPDPHDPGYLMDGTVDPNYGGGASSSGAPPDPNAPGYLTDGSPDPNYGAGAAAAGPPDYGMGPPPTAASVAPQPNVDYVPEPYPGAQGDVAQYSSDPGTPGTPVPVGAVFYDGSQAPPYLGLGSYSFYYGSVDGDAPPEGGAGPVRPVGGGYADGGSGYQYHDKDGWWSFRRNDSAGPAGSGDQRLQHADDQSNNAMIARANNSMKYHWGPMIGDPNGGWTRGMRYDVGGNQWFWYYDAAPAWAQGPITQALQNQAILDYQANVAAAAADYAAQQAADKLAAEQAQEMQRQQAAESAQQAHQLEMEQAQAQSDAGVQQLADEAQARQADIESAQYEAQTQAEAQAQATLEQSEMLTQAKIDQQAAETAASIDAQMAQTTAAMQPPDDGEDYSSMDDEGGSPDGTSLDDDVLGAQLKPFGSKNRRSRRHK